MCTQQACWGTWSKLQFLQHRRCLLYHSYSPLSKHPFWLSSSFDPGTPCNTLLRNFADPFRGFKTNATRKAHSRLICDPITGRIDSVSSSFQEGASSSSFNFDVVVRCGEMEVELRKNQIHRGLWLSFRMTGLPATDRLLCCSGQALICFNIVHTFPSSKVYKGYKSSMRPQSIKFTRWMSEPESSTDLSWNLCFDSAPASLAVCSVGDRCRRKWDAWEHSGTVYTA